jgi:hypothetical protein
MKPPGELPFAPPRTVFYAVNHNPMECARHDPPGRSPNRREFLKTSLAGGVVLGAAGFVAQCTRQEIARPQDLVFLNAREFSTLAAFARAVLPSAAPEAVNLTPYRVDREVARWSPKSQAQVRQVLALVENGTRYFLFSWRPFSGLSMRARQEYLRGWETSSLSFRRTAFQALRMLAFFYYYSQDSAWHSIGYDGPWVKPGATT